MKPKKMTTILIASAVLAVAYPAFRMTSRTAYENASYTVEQSDGEFEVRSYPELRLVSTKTRFARQGNDGSFNRLFQYISGRNDQQKKVAMTVPVFMSPDATSDSRMNFVIPAEVARQGAPVPTDADVSLETRAAGRYAVVTFAGRLDDDSYAAQKEKLRTWVSESGFTPISASFEAAGYDPPWVPGFLRRNEVLVRLD